MTWSRVLAAALPAVSFLRGAATPFDVDTMVRASVEQATDDPRPTADKLHSTLSKAAAILKSRFKGQTASNDLSREDRAGLVKVYAATEKVNFMQSLYLGEQAPTDVLHSGHKIPMQWSLLWPPFLVDFLRTESATGRPAASKLLKVIQFPRGSAGGDRSLQLLGPSVGLGPLPATSRQWVDLSQSAVLVTLDYNAADRGVRPGNVFATGFNWQKRLLGAWVRAGLPENRWVCDSGYDDEFLDEGEFLDRPARDSWLLYDGARILLYAELNGAREANARTLPQLFMLARLTGPWPEEEEHQSRAAAAEEEESREYVARGTDVPYVGRASAREVIVSPGDHDVAPEEPAGDHSSLPSGFLGGVGQLAGALFRRVSGAAGGVEVLPASAYAVREKVEYWSVSYGEWIPGTVLDYVDNFALGDPQFLRLDCKSYADPKNVRKVAAPPPLPPAPPLVLVHRGNVAVFRGGAPGEVFRNLSMSVVRRDAAEREAFAGNWGRGSMVVFDPTLCKIYLGARASGPTRSTYVADRKSTLSLGALGFNPQPGERSRQHGVSRHAGTQITTSGGRNLVLTPEARRKLELEWTVNMINFYTTKGGPFCGSLASFCSSTADGRVGEDARELIRSIR